MEYLNTDIILNKLGSRIVSKAKSNLVKRGNNNTKKLYNSLKFVVSGNELAFFMEDYGESLDAGRHGRNKRVNSRSLFKPSKAGFPNLTKIKKWVRTKPVKFSNTNKKVNVDSMAFVIGRSIERKGIKASLFFSDAYLLGMKELSNTVLDAVASDLEELLINDLKE